VVGASSQLQASERYPIVWFLVLFPVLVLLVFAWLVSKHHQKLYAPLDYKSDEAFIAASLREARPTLAELDAQIEEKVHTVLNSNEMISAIQAGGDVKSRLRYAANPHFSRRVGGGAGLGRLIAAESAMEVGRVDFGAART
jgi:hypothetical protein